MSDDSGPASFFRAATEAFGATISARQKHIDLVAGLCAQAFDLFERNVAIQAEGTPQIACKGECAACCRLRVVTTAPEIFLLARFVEANAQAFEARGTMLSQRIISIALSVGNLDEAGRMAAKRECPFIESDLCLAYRLRPLACRGHAALDRRACVSVAAGGEGDASVSTPHLVVRSLVQSAMMNGMRKAGLAWGLYELTRGVKTAISAQSALDAWLGGGDPLAEAKIPDFDAVEAVKLFDALSPD